MNGPWLLEYCGLEFPAGGFELYWCGWLEGCDDPEVVAVNAWYVFGVVK